MSGDARYPVVHRVGYLSVSLQLYVARRSPLLVTDAPSPVPMTLSDPNPDADPGASHDGQAAAEYRWLTIDTGTQALYDPGNPDAWIQSDTVELLQR